MGIDFISSFCKEFFSGHFKTQDLFRFRNFYRKKIPSFVALKGVKLRASNSFSANKS